MPSSSSKILKSSFVIIVAKWVQRILGLVSFFILARILGAEDFGIVAMSFVVLGFFRSITETGPHQYLLSRSEITRETADTTWTLNLLSKMAVALLMVILASFFSRLFNEPRLEMVLYVASVVPVINGLQSAGQYYLQREFRYTALSISQVISKVISFIVSLWVALAYETYWALIVGDILYAGINTVATYFIHDYRPRLSIVGIAKQWDFSKWVLLKSSVGFLRSKIDQFMVSIFFPTHGVGLFNVAKELTLMPYTQIAEPLGPVYISAINNVKNDAVQLADAFSKIFTTIITVILPTAVGFFLLRDEIVSTLLGGKWEGAELLVAYFAPLILTTSLASLSSSTLTALHKVKLVFILDMLTMFIVLGGQYWARELPIHEFAGIRSIMGLIILVVLFLAVKKHIPEMRMLRLVIAAVPSVVAVAVMIYIVGFCQDSLSGIWMLIFGSLAGAITYALVFAGLSFKMKKISPDIAFIYDKSIIIFAKMAAKFTSRKDAGML